MIANGLSVVEAHKLINLTEKLKLCIENKYLIFHQWWLEFLRKTENAGSSDYIELPPISNELLVCKTVCGYEIRPNLIENFDFTSVPEVVFNELRKAFGFEDETRDIITVKLINGMQELKQKSFVEDHLLELKTALFSEQSNVIALKVSSAESVDGMCAKAMNALNIPEKQCRIAQLMIKKNNKFEYLSSGIAQNKFCEILSSGTVIYIDETGKGPEREACKSNRKSRSRFSYSAIQTKLRNSIEKKARYTP
ncbi:ubiquitinyl hydrolase 1 [Ditylenchus destructor]|uniref:Ubiquitinyl hydrolase 1 n=1 Tax=Ditylenchus destructor TaxID=166010 RepID=A0AAD4MWM5_9BILA|nr:ubiquitinyl hydrolase 1 [Ditylenchus destructor]